MDETEISNTKYKQFVFWVRDSIAITNYLNDQKYYMQPRKGAAADPNGRKYINWEYVASNPVFLAHVVKMQQLTLQNYRGCITREMTGYLTVTKLIYAC
jgi:hypothetical protein